MGTKIEPDYREKMRAKGGQSERSEPRSDGKCGEEPPHPKDTTIDTRPFFIEDAMNLGYDMFSTSKGIGVGYRMIVNAREKNT